MIFYDSEIGKAGEEVKTLEAKNSLPGILEEQREILNDDIAHAKEDLEKLLDAREETRKAYKLLSRATKRQLQRIKRDS